MIKILYDIKYILILIAPINNFPPIIKDVTKEVDMREEKLIGKLVKNKDGENLTIVSVDNADDVKCMKLRLNNEKVYLFYVAYKNGFLKFVDDELNEELDSFIKEENDLENAKLKKEKLVRQKAEKNDKLVLSGSIDKFRGDYGFLSNFYECSVTYEGFTYRCSEAAFQAQKDLSKRELFTSLDGRGARKLGKSRTEINLRRGWNEMRISLMEKILECKFDQNPELKKALIETGNKCIVEGNTWNDTFWGVCKGKGRNNLGKLLMELRKKYQNEGK